MALSRPMRIALVVLAALGAVFASYAVTQRSVGPDLTFTTLDDRRIGSPELRGKVVLVTFWATSCPICMSEMPDLVQTYRQYQSRGFELIAVAMAYDTPDAVKKVSDDKSLPFPVVMDTSGDLARAFDGTSVVPTAFLIDRSGKVVSKTLGAIDFSKLRQYLDASLGT